MKGKITIIIDIASNGTDYIVVGLNVRIASPKQLTGQNDIENLVGRVIE